MEKKTAILIAAALFPHYPSVNEFHITSDEQPFFNAVDASNHAKGLESKEVTVVVREDLKGSKLKVVETPAAASVETPEVAPVETPAAAPVETPAAATVKKSAKTKNK